MFRELGHWKLKWHGIERKGLVLNGGLEDKWFALADYKVCRKFKVHHERNLTICV